MITLLVLQLLNAAAAMPSETEPPWWLFSARCPCVRCEPWSSLWENGSVPPRGERAWLSQASHTTMMPIDSYHDARLVSYVAWTLITSPGLTRGRQSACVAPIAMSQEIGPRGSQGCPLDPNARPVFAPALMAPPLGDAPLRVRLRSS